MEFDHRTRFARTSTADAADHTLAPGKRTLSEQLPVQRREATAGPGPAADASRRSTSTPSGVPHLPLEMLFGLRPAPAEPPGARDGAAVHASAARGIATAASPLPHGDAIQRAFGHHDVSSVHAHLGREAAASADAMGASAYATGHHVVFGGAPDLHTAAHEAAHVVQQRAGVRVDGGVGRVGDDHERHADQVADRVVAGRSAVDLLDQVNPAGRGDAVAQSTGVVQRSPSDAQDFLKEKGVDVPLDQEVGVPLDQVRQKFMVLLDRLLNEGKIDLAALETALHRFDVAPGKDKNPEESDMLRSEFEPGRDLAYQREQDFVPVKQRAQELEPKLRPWDHDRQEARTKELKMAQTIENCLSAMYELQDRCEHSKVEDAEIVKRCTAVESKLGVDKMALKAVKTQGLTQHQILLAKIVALEERWHSLRYGEMDRRVAAYETLERTGRDSGSTARGPYGKPGLIGRRPRSHESSTENRDTLWLQGHGDWRMPTATAEKAKPRPITSAQSGTEGGFFTMEQVLAAANQRLAAKLQGDLSGQDAPEIDAGSFEVVFIAPHGAPSKTSSEMDTAGPYDILKLNKGVFSMPFLELVEGSDTFLIPNYSLGRREPRHQAPEWDKPEDNSSAKNFGVSDVDQDLQIQDPRDQHTLKASLYDIMIQVLATEAEKQVRQCLARSEPLPRRVRASLGGRKLRFAWVNCRVESDSVVWLRSELRRFGPHK